MATHVDAKELRRDVNRDVIQAWLDALATGACDEQAFFDAIQKLARKSVEAGWDSLSLVDQYYRRGRISAELFNSLRARLGSQLVGQQSADPDKSVPLPRGESELEESVPVPPPPRPQGTAARPEAVSPRPRAASSPPPASASPPPTPPGPSQAVTVRLQTSPPRRSNGVTAVSARADADEPAGMSDLPLTLPNPNARDSRPRASRSRDRTPLDLGSHEARLPDPKPGGSEHHADRREIGVGDLLRGRYQIKSILGKGGTGLVFEAADLYRIDTPEAGQRVALKVLHTQVSDRSDLSSDLQREFQILQALSHPNIVRVHDYDRDGDLAFLTMEYLRGLSLFGLLSARSHAPVARAYALAIVRDVGAALAHAHAKGVVHGDLNPGNIFITNEGDVRVLDFGAAHSPSSGPVVSLSESDSMPIATPRYASVQVLEGKRADARDDVYALACITYLLLAGKHPFNEKTALAAQTESLRPARPPNLAHKEWQALKLGLSFDRERRPSNVEEWLHSFEWRRAAGRLPVLLALVRVNPEERKSSVWPVLGIAATVLLAAGIWIRFDFGRNELVPREPEPAGEAATENGEPAQATAPAPGASRSVTTAPAPSAARSATAPGPSASQTATASPESASRRPQTAVVESGAAPAAPTAPMARTGATPSPGGPPSNARSGAALDSAAPTAAGSPTLPASQAPASSARSTPSSSSALTAAASAAPSPAAASSGPRGSLPPPESARSAAAAADGSVPIRSRIELAGDTVDVPITDPAARVLVRRKGNLHGEVTFTWWTESGTAKPGQDFMAVSPHPEIIEDGKNSVSLFIPVVGDSTRRQPKSFYVVINDPSAGVALGSRTLTMVTIPPSD
jgi:serine/threonine protein kinase